MTALVVIPTYNEKVNLPILVDKIGRVREKQGTEVLFVDDNSPDGTGVLADQFAAEFSWVHVLHRPEKKGLGTAYVEGFRYGLEHDYDLLLEMDADLSHDPAAIPDLLRAASSADVVLGSRYIPGGGVENWGIGRQLISRGGSLYARKVLGLPVRDLTGGFKCFRREVLKSLDLDHVRSNGYCFQIEMTYRAHQKGFRIVEVPITFRDRVAGDSKMSRRIVLEAMWRVLKLRVEGRDRPAWVEPVGASRSVEEMLDMRPAPSMLPSQPGAAWPTGLNCSIGVMAHNEEATIGKVLDGLLRQELSLCHINEIFVVASGCTDHTVDAAKRLADQDERVKVLVQERREGKASAINLFLRNASEDIVIVMGGDTIPSPSMVERLISPLANPEVGMTGGRPVPLNDSRTFFGFASHLLWDLHHELALQSPKLGEAVAFRKLFSIIPVDTPVDELSVQALITGMGLKLQYVQDAVLYNRGPDNLHDFISQRRRIYCGHLRVQADQMYEASTMDARRILPLWLRRLGPGPKNAMWACCVAGLEFYSRIMGRQDFRCKKQHHVWSVVSSTKQVTKGLREGRAIDNRDSLLALRIRDFDGLSARLGRREAQQMIGRLADFLAGDLREGRLIKTVPAKGLIVLTADVDNLEVEQAIARASMRMRPGNLSTAKAGVTAIASFDFTYGLFPLGEGFGPAGKFVAGDAQARAGQGLDGLVQM